MRKGFKGLWSVLVLVLGICLVGVALVGCSDAGGEAEKVEELAETSKEEVTEENEQAAEAEDADATEAQVVDAAQMDEVYNAQIVIKDYGTVDLELYPEIAPETVANFVKLADEGFYNGLTFHRIMDGFMIQGGDPTGTGMGGSDQTITGEFSSNGIENDLSHARGVISMARSNDPNSASSQFFIVQKDSQFLDGQYAAFGRVTSGMDVVDAIAKDAKPTDNNGTIPADQQPVIESITVEGPISQN